VSKELRFGDWFNVTNIGEQLPWIKPLALCGVSGWQHRTHSGSALLVQAPSAFRFGAKFTF
jgi:hypothetical protein